MQDGPLTDRPWQSDQEKCVSIEISREIQVIHTVHAVRGYSHCSGATREIRVDATGRLWSVTSRGEMREEMTIRNTEALAREKIAEQV